jgi:hypothetical protein
MDDKPLAISGQYAQELLRKNKFTPNPDGLISHIPLDQNRNYAWTDINAGAVRRGDEVPEHPIRILFKKVQRPPMLGDTLELDYVRELTADEFKTSKSLGREDLPKISPWPKK